MRTQSAERALIAKREKLRYSYNPKSARLLFVPESPPSSGGFFYNGKTIGRDYLFAETMRALKLWPDYKEMEKDIDKRALLKRFQSMGCFLIDTSLYAVDKMKGQERDRRLREQIPRLIE